MLCTQNEFNSVGSDDDEEFTKSIKINNNILIMTTEQLKELQTRLGLLRGYL